MREVCSSTRNTRISRFRKCEHIKLGGGASFWSRACGRNAFVLGSEVNIRGSEQAGRVECVHTPEGWVTSIVSMMSQLYRVHDMSRG
jgi:hypothetical protein